ncbi:MAG: 3-isopropylmalate dehydratase large subunit [Steroidobacteraceae bacterium]
MLSPLPPPTNRRLTLSEKILQRASGADARPGDIVTAKVDLAMMHDSGGPRRVAPHLEHLGARVWDPDKVVVVTDHFVPPNDVGSAEILALTRRWAADNAIRRFHDMQGICHVVVQERGYLRPGMFIVGGDSHSPSGGAVGAFMIGIGATEMAGVLVTGEIWLRVPHTYRVRWRGALGPARSAKDIMLFLCRELGMNNDYKVMEYCGPAVDALPMEERLVLCNMSAELGAKTGIIAPDRATLAAIREAGGEVDEASLEWRSDPDASFERSFDFDATALEPQVAAPHSPANSSAARDHAGVKIDQAYIGACTGAKLSDLHMAAMVLKDRKVASGVRLLVAPASTRATRIAAADGTLATLTDAGAILLPTGCGACAGYGAGVLAKDEVCIASTARNFKGRMGHKDSRVYLGSPYTVAASAVAGYVTDPREFIHP